MWTNFDKAWLAPAIAQWLEAGIVGLVEHAAGIDIPANIESYILLALTSAIVYIIPNKKAAAPVAPAA
jgi:hypothetical protein